MASIINASTTSTSGLVQTADASGVLQLQSNGVTGLTVEANASITVSGNLTTARGAVTSLVTETAKNSTTGTSVDFTGIPSWAKRVTLMLNGVSTNGTSIMQVQLGAGTIQNTGYEAEATGFQGAALLVSGVYTSGFPLGGDNRAADLLSGTMVFTSFGSNIWIGSCAGGANNGGTGRTFHGGGRVTLTGTLDRIRLTTTNGTDTFDTGSVNIMYE